MSSRTDGEDGFATVVLAYGDSPFLSEALASLAAQTSPVQIVVATSTPSDFIRDAARTAGAPLIVNPNRTDIAGDWNFALGLTDARFVTLAHQDDWYAPRFSAETRAAFARTPDAALCFTGYQEIDDAGAPKSSKISRVKHLIELFTLVGARRVRGLQLKAFLAFGNPLPCSSVTFDRTRARDFRFSEAFASNLDWDAWLRLCESDAVFTRVPQRLVGRRHNPLTATSGLIRDGTRRTEDLMMFQRLWPRPFAEAIALLYRTGYG